MKQTPKYTTERDQIGCLTTSVNFPCIRLPDFDVVLCKTVFMLIDYTTDSSKNKFWHRKETVKLLGK